jgi:hypothetical protein
MATGSSIMGTISPTGKGADLDFAAMATLSPKSDKSFNVFDFNNFRLSTYGLSEDQQQMLMFDL